MSRNFKELKEALGDKDYYHQANFTIEEIKIYCRGVDFIGMNKFKEGFNNMMEDVDDDEEVNLLKNKYRRNWGRVLE